MTRSTAASYRLVPGESQTYEFLVEAETFGSRGISHTPESDCCISRGVEHNDRAVLDSVRQHPGWVAGVRRPRCRREHAGRSVGDPHNTDEAKVAEFELRVEVDTSGDVPQPSTEDLHVEIRLR